MVELDRLARPLLSALGMAEQQSQLQRRKRDLHSFFEIELLRVGRDYRHRLVGRRATPRSTGRGISAKDRAIVLQAGRCAMCGRTPLEDRVKLVVDHKLPLDWGGTNDLENLQPLCEECNSGKKAHFATYDEFAPRIRQAARYDRPHMRIGELLKAFNGGAVPSDLLQAVASAKQYQEDWQKRLRELRELGWVIKPVKRRVGKRMQASYKLAHAEPWPEGNIRAEITRREREKKLRRRRV